MHRQDWKDDRPGAEGRQGRKFQCLAIGMEKERNKKRHIGKWWKGMVSEEAHSSFRDLPTHDHFPTGAPETSDSGEQVD